MLQNSREDLYVSEMAVFGLEIYHGYLLIAVGRSRAAWRAERTAMNVEIETAILIQTRKMRMKRTGLNYLLCTGEIAVRFRILESFRCWEADFES
jgi:N-acetylglutamate synthase/N-acetylornithine aminotransferase